MILKLITEGQLLHRDDFPNRMIAGNVKIDKIEFEFDENWNGFTKTVVFSRNGKIVPILLDDTNVCDVPPEVTTENGLVGIGVFGIKGEQKYVSEEIQIFFEKGVPTDGVLLGEYTPDIYQQILNLATEAVETSKRVEAETKELNEQSKAVLDAETERVEAENIRQSSEESRNTSEQSRQEGEYTRARAEEERQQTFEDLKGEVESLQSRMSEGLSDFEENSQQALDEFNEQATEKLEAFDKEFTDAITDASHGLADFENRSSEALDAFATQSAEELEKVQIATDRANEVVDNMPNVYANALKGTASGEVISITDISPIEHNLGVKLSSKNIYNPKGRIIPKTVRGLTIQYLEDEDCYLLNGTTEITNNYYQINENILVDDYISIAVSVVGGSVNNPNNKYVRFYVGSKDTENGTTSNWQDINLVDGIGKSTTSKKYIGASWFYIGDGVTFDNFKVRISIEKGTKATPYTPFVEDVSKATLKAQGKNLFPPEALDIKNYTKIKWGTYEYVLPNMPAGKYYFSATPGETPPGEGDVGYFYTYKRAKGSEEWKMSTQIIAKHHRVYAPNVVFESGYDYKFWVYTSVLDVLPLDFFTDIQLEVGDSATPYEPYIEPTSYKPNADGTVEGVKSIYPTTTLYTDTSGVLVECEYNKDTNKVIENLVNAIISLGGNV